MAKKNARGTDEVKGDVNLSPMIDCCFLLLIFFVVNATQITVAKNLSVKMPSAVSCSDLKDAKGCIVVNVFTDTDKMDEKALREFHKQQYASGTIWGVTGEGGKPVGYTDAQESDLTEYIQKQKDVMENRKIDGKNIRLYLRGDKSTPWERSAKAIQCAAKAGVTNVVFGTLPSKK